MAKHTINKAVEIVKVEKEIVKDVTLTVNVEELEQLKKAMSTVSFGHNLYIELVNALHKAKGGIR